MLAGINLLASAYLMLIFSLFLPQFFQYCYSLIVLGFPFYYDCFCLLDLFCCRQSLAWSGHSFSSSFNNASLIFAAIVFGSLLGLGLSETVNIKNTEYITSFDTALPTKLLDINGELITEFASDEKREIISLNRLPQHMIDALLTREDRIY